MEKSLKKLVDKVERDIFNDRSITNALTELAEEAYKLGRTDALKEAGFNE